MPPRVAVVGGGIAGLAAAWDLAGSGAEVAIYEPGHLGGKLVTSEFMGRPVDEGPDAMLARVPEGVALCAELGLSGELEPPAASEALVWARGKLRPLPHGLVLGAPARLLPLARSGLLSAGALARAAADLVLPATRRSEDESVWDLVASRFGAGVAENLVGPLVGAIYAGSIRGLSAAVAAPQLLAAAKSNRSLLVALRAAGKRVGAGGSGPVFLAPKPGMQAIADRLVAALRTKGAVVFRDEVTALRRDGQAIVVEPRGESYSGAVLAAPAPCTSRLLKAFGIGRGDLGALDALQWASVGMVTVAISDGQLTVPAGASGLLVAPGSEMLMTACSFGDNKWPHWGAPGATVLRVSVGKAGDERWSSLTDEALVDRTMQEVGLVLADGKALSPLGWRVSRWPAALPQYPVGHFQQMAALRAALNEEAPTVFLAGASYGRVGVPACIGSGRQAATSVVQSLRALNEPSPR